MLVIGGLFREAKEIASAIRGESVLDAAIGAIAEPLSTTRVASR